MMPVRGTVQNFKNLCNEEHRQSSGVASNMRVGHIASAGVQACRINGVLVLCPQRGPEAKPSKAENLLVLRVDLPTKVLTFVIVWKLSRIPISQSINHSCITIRAQG